MTILDRIVEDTRDVVAQRKRMRSRSDLEDQPGFGTLTLSLAEALRQDDLAVLAELKKASPSKGIIREDFDIQALALEYEEAGAAAVSVLTEPHHFMGSIDYLKQVRQTIDLPLLRKDFILDEYQLFEARAYGADAVLLIAAILDPVHLYDLHQVADALDLSCLVEVYDFSELDGLDFDQIQILGVNNRDLRTFEVDINHSLRVFAEVPRAVVRVSESGLKTAQDLVHLRENGIDAVLIGETFMREPSPGQTLAQLKADVLALLSASA